MTPAVVAATAATVVTTPRGARLAVSSFTASAAAASAAAVATTVSAAAVDTLVLVLAHANGLCKESWLPAARRVAARFLDHQQKLQPAPLLPRRLVVHTFDSFYSGDSAALNRGRLRPPQQQPGDPIAGFDWDDLARDAAAVAVWARQLAERENRPSGSGSRGRVAVVGVGHSVGGYSLLRAAQFLLLDKNASGVGGAGGLDAVVAVDPVISVPGEMVLEGPSPLAAGALRRRDEFPSRAAARASFRARPFFASWSDAGLDAYVAHGLEPVEPVTGGGGHVDDAAMVADDSTPVRLKCRREDEAAAFAWRDLGTLAFAALPALAAAGSCRLHVLAGGLSDIGQLWPPLSGGPGSRAAAVAAAAAPISSVSVLDGLGHMLVVEDPDRVGDAVFDALV
ncbi:hypothetical protein HK405_014488, partial [Cladochytrium tenue]